jgi:hypothetical protein
MIKRAVGSKDMGVGWVKYLHSNLVQMECEMMVRAVGKKVMDVA